MKYFAYGSNMLETRLKDPSRAPSALCIGIGILSGHRIRFNKVGKDGSAKCNVQETRLLDDIVFGVIYRIADEEILSLDKIEGVSIGGYLRREVKVEISGSDTEMMANTYIADQQCVKDDMLPFEWYKALVVAGAIEHNLPKDYIQLLRLQQSLPDRNQERESKALDILGPWRLEYLSGRLTGGFGSRS